MGGDKKAARMKLSPKRWISNDKMRSPPYKAISSLTRRNKENQYTKETSTTRNKDTITIKTNENFTSNFNDYS